MKKNKTIATWLAFVAGPLGLHRFYLHGLGDIWAWLHPIPTALGLYGIGRARQFGLDDQWSWALVPLLGFAIAASCLTAIYYGLQTPEKWNAAHNPQLEPEAQPGRSNWFTIIAVVLALLFGATALMSSIVYSFQRYFEYQIEEGRKLSQ
jgi:TM2 domain-containing membrane protein YozV